MGLFDSISSTLNAGAMISQQIQSKVDQASSFVNASGNVGQLVSSVYSKPLNQVQGLTQADITKWMSTPTKLMGGVSPNEAKALFEEYSAIELASKKLYLIEVIDLKPAGFSPNWQFFVTEMSYSPITLTADKKKIGSSVMDMFSQTEHTDLTMTTWDDKKGTIKRWADSKASKTAASDGTVGLPIDYLLRIKILHSFFSEGSNKGGYRSKFLMRLVSAEYGHSRSEGGFQDIQLQFTQFDTSMAA